ncbi:hypothetical protein FBU30_009757 [Linnemannia zychae]|nr:hypothetical protein FBU30_009757 [Linnemannia zychae]
MLDKAHTFLSISGTVIAFLVFTSKSTAGCPIDISYYVQYSDLAQLKWVQLQILGPDNSLMVESLDNSTRAYWNDLRTKTVTWDVPKHWPLGDYIIRAFGNASYPCQRGAQREHCDFELEDRETFHLQALPVGQVCPISLSGSSFPSTTDGAPLLSPSLPRESTMSSGNSADSYIKSSIDLLSKNLASASLDDENSFSNNDSNQKSIYNSGIQKIQDQTILKVLDEILDYNLQTSTLTLRHNGQVVPMSDWMDNSTIERFVQTLELSKSNFYRLTGKNVGSNELIETLQKNISLITIPPLSSLSSPQDSTTTEGLLTTKATAPFNHTEVNPFGRGFVQQDQNQTQGKSSDAISIAITIADSVFAIVLVVVISTMTL